MRFHIFDEPMDSYKVAILIKPTSFNKSDLERYYVKTLEGQGMSKASIIAYDLEYNMGKVKAKEGREYVKELLKTLKELRVKYVYCADAEYFKLITGEKKAEQHLGYRFTIPNTDMLITLGINYSSLLYNPENLQKLNLSLQTLKDIINEDYTALGTGIIHSATYPTTIDGCVGALKSTLNLARVSCDIEAYSLDFDKAGIGTIAFAQDQHNGIAMPVDYITGHKPNRKMRKMLKEFFMRYNGKLIFHNANYDIKVLIANLFMKDLLDTEGMLEGIEVMTKNLDDTYIMAYLAYNSTAKPKLNLKTLCHEFAGNYAVDDIKDIKRIPMDELLEYNLVDCLCTNYLYDDITPKLEDEGLTDLYRGLMLDSVRLLLQVELTGMPINLDQVALVKARLTEEVDKALHTLTQYEEIEQTEQLLRQRALDAKNLTLKKLVHTIDMPVYQEMKFNPNSGQQLQTLFHDVMDLPILALTKTKQPATGAKTLQALLAHTPDHQKPILQAIIDYSSVAKILESFIPAFERALDKGHSVHYLHGSFVIGGTVSGRLSSKRPNLQNIPSGSKWAGLIKECFQAPDGWVMCGADFSSLEDRIGALLTKDPNMLKVYTDGYDGHSLKAYAYFAHLMPDIKLEVDDKVCFELNGQPITEDTMLMYKGTAYTGKELYEQFGAISNVKKTIQH